MKVINKLITGLSYIKSKSKRRLISIAKMLTGKYGLEIGGPSSIFKLKGIFPVYIFAKKIDGVNFSTSTIWEGALSEGNNFNYFNGYTGYQYIAEATNLKGIADNKYNFILSSHSLEHTANPLKALFEWKRVLKQGGELVLVLPDKNGTFDNNRPYTEMEHLIADYRNNTEENDTTHLEEIIQLHDYTKDVITNKQQMVERLQYNYENRCAHHHVFSLELIRRMAEYTGFKVIHQQTNQPFHLVTVAIKRD